jgi:hypothetical protein
VDSIAAEQAQANGNGVLTSTKLSPTRRKKRALALSLAQRLIEMTVNNKGWLSFRANGFMHINIAFSML